MRPKKTYEKPQLRPIDTDGSEWQAKLPKIRELAEQALREVELAGDTEIGVGLRALLEGIDREIENAER